MNWQSQLISIYLIICEELQQGIKLHIDRKSHNKARLTDEEVLTILFFGLIRGYRTLKEIYQHINSDFKDWFPDLKSYGALHYRVNRFSDVYPLLVRGAYKGVLWL